MGFAGPRPFRAAATPRLDGGLRRGSGCRELLAGLAALARGSWSPSPQAPSCGGGWWCAAVAEEGDRGELGAGYCAAEEHGGVAAGARAGQPVREGEYGSEPGENLVTGVSTGAGNGDIHGCRHLLGDVAVVT